MPSYVLSCHVLDSQIYYRPKSHHGSLGILVRHFNAGRLLVIGRSSAGACPVTYPTTPITCGGYVGWFYDRPSLRGHDDATNHESVRHATEHGFAMHWLMQERRNENSVPLY